MSEVKNYVRDFRIQEIESSLNSILTNLESENLKVEFGKIGTRTTYAMIYNEDYSVEIVGYTFVKDPKFYKENLGKLKALQQAMARKKISDQQG